MDASEVSVIIPTYNSLQFLARTIAALERQKPDPTSFEVVVIDDGSIDGTGSWLRSYSDRLRIRSESFPHNRGRSFARNRGVELASGSLIIFIDGDMEFGADFISGHASRHDGQAKAVIGRVLYNLVTGNRGYAKYLETRGAVKLKPDEPVPGRYFLSGNVSLPGSVIKNLGGFDPDIDVYGEDIDFGMRLETAGVPLSFAPELKVEHLHLRSIEEALVLAYEYGRKSIPRLIDKHPQLYHQLKLSWYHKKGLTGAVRKMFLAVPFFSTIKTTTRFMNSLSLPAKVYDYLLYRSYLYGYRDFVNQKQS